MTRWLTLSSVPWLLVACASGSGESTPLRGASSAGSSGKSSGGGGGASGGSGAGGMSAGTASSSGGNVQGGASGGVGGGAGGAGTNAAGGNASCPATASTRCASACVNTATDANHCGGCNRPCSNGMSCVASVCACPNGQSLCNGKCIDTQSDPQNCGTCGNACTTGSSCRSGGCACAEGKTLCSGSCADLMQDAANCGACGTKCSGGQACSAGKCASGQGGTTGADGCSGLAANITLSNISVYQTVEIPVMKAGAEVAASSRNTDVVAGRDALFRVFVTLGSGWTSRSIAARVTLDNGGSVDTYSSKKSPTKGSDPADIDSTFQILVPKDKVTPNTTYQVELLECGGSGTASGGSGGGAASSARFPADKAISLGARNTGALKVKVIPLVANSLQPDTSDSALEVYKTNFLALYPVSSVEISVGSSLSVTNAKDWTGMLDQMRSRRRSDAPANDVYYYGMLKPAATLREYCGNGCTAGIGYVVGQGSGAQQAAQRASMGLAYADGVSANTMAHEIGHNHGRNHAPCVPQGSSISGVDSMFPYSGGKVGVYGWDMRSMALMPPSRTDIMGYCTPVWMSDYTYDGILTRVASVNGALAEDITPSSIVHPWRVVLLDVLGARWGIPITEPSPPSGAPELADVLDARGDVIDTVTVYRTEISDINAYSIEVPEPKAGWTAIRVAGAGALSYP